MTFTIQRSTWDRGQLCNESSSLLDPHTKNQCCLGFFATACGLTDDQIRGVTVPIRIDPDVRKGTPLETLIDTQGSQLGHTEICEQLLSANDTATLRESAREERITALFAELGHVVRFET